MVIFCDLISMVSRSHVLVVDYLVDWNKLGALSQADRLADRMNGRYGFVSYRLYLYGISVV